MLSTSTRILIGNLRKFSGLVRNYIRTGGFVIDRIDHVVLTVRDIKRTCDFYTNILGMEEMEFGPGRKALLFGRQKFNLHQAGYEFEPKAKSPTVGSADICLITYSTIDKVIEHLSKNGVAIENGPVRRSGAIGGITSVYCRDPDDNLIEISHYC